MPSQRSSAASSHNGGSEVPLHAGGDLVVAGLTARRGGSRGQRLLALREDLEMLARSGNGVDDLDAADALRHRLRLEPPLALRRGGAPAVAQRPVPAADRPGDV